MIEEYRAKRRDRLRLDSKGGAVEEVAWCVVCTANMPQFVCDVGHLVV